MSRNLETARVEGLRADSYCATYLAATSLTAPARKISTQWHSQLRLPAMIAEPKLRTSYSYDTIGNLLSKTEQATSDATGAQGFAAPLVGPARTWTYTYNTVGQVLTATGPRTDVNDTTTYSYDGQGNLTSVTNAAGHVTSLSNYDAHGHVGRITDVNGVTTDIAYSLRGWVTSRTATSQGRSSVTSYEYDGAGQLKKLTLPDGSYLSYTYDAAHRLTDLGDSAGNRVHYTLDNAGNRVKEEVTGSGGTLARQTARVYDVLGQLKQMTGGAQ
jgi:YD repeat-containing protein